MSIDLYQKERIESCIHATILSLANGPTRLGSEESVDAYKKRLRSWGKCKVQFLRYCLDCLSTIDPSLAYKLHEKAQEIVREQREVLGKQ